MFRKPTNDKVSKKTEKVVSKTGEHSPKLSLQLAKTALAMLIIMTSSECLKQIIVPNIPIWQSHSITILFTSTLATIVSYFVFGRLNLLYRRSADEATLRKKAEEAARESDTRYRQIVESADDMIYRADAKGHLTFFNPVTLRTTGFSVEELTGKHYLELVRLDYQAEVKGFYALQLKDKTPNTYFEFPVTTKDGKEIWLGQNVQLQGDGDRIVGFQAVARNVTERVRAEKALRESEKRYRDLVDNANSIILQWDAEGNIVFMNPYGLDFFGYSEEELIGRNVMGTIVPKIESTTERDLSAMIEDIRQDPDKYKDNENENMRKNGSRVWVSWTNKAITHKKGSPVEVLSIGNDITTQKRVEEALRESEDRFRTLVANIPGTVYRCAYDPNWTMEYISPEIFNLSGYPASDFINNTVRSYASIIHPEDETMVARAVDEGLTHKRPYVIEYRIVHKDGSLRWVYEKGQGVFGEEGGTQYLDGAILDITDRKTVEEALQKLSLAIQQSPASVVITNQAGTIEYVNRKFTEVTGYSAEEAIGKNPRILQSGELPLEFYKNMWDTILAGASWSGEIHNKKKDGELYWEQASISPVRNPLGKITHFVAVKEDVTEKKRVAEELRRAKEAAEVANRAKSDFLASMSHELRTPLNAVIGFSEVLRDKYFGPLTEKQEEYVEDIVASGKHLLSLINDILDLSKIEAGKMELELSQVNVKNLLEGSLVMIKEKCLKHGISLDLHVPVELSDLEIQADERKVKQIMFNLLSNAAKFTPSSGAITIEAEQKEKELTIRVSDTGIGIASEDQEKIFEEFYQAGSTMVGKTPGTGLGLPLVRRFLELHGGKICIKSEGIGKGSCFSLTLPLERGFPELEISELFLKHLERIVSLSKRNESIFSLCRLHDEGEAPGERPFTLKEMLEKEKRAYDFFAADESGYLYLIFQDTNREGAKIACERILKKMADVIEGLKITCSIATFPEDGETVETLIEKVRLLKGQSR